MTGLYFYLKMIFIRRYNEHGHFSTPIVFTLLT